MIYFDHCDGFQDQIIKLDVFFHRRTARPAQGILSWIAGRSAWAQETRASAGRCQGMRLAFDPTPMVSHMTLHKFWGRVECEKVAFLAAKRGSRR